MLEYVQIPNDCIQRVMLMIPSEKEQMKMYMWMMDYIGKGLSKEQVMDKAREIALGQNSQAGEMGGSCSPER